MPFTVNDSFLFLAAGAVIAFVVAQSIFFMVKAITHAKHLGIQKSVIRKTILSSALFSVAPAVSILVGVLSLSSFLGLPLPWLRLSVLGAITYEMPAATVAASAMGITDISVPIADPKVFAAIAWVMTLGILSGIILVLFGLKKIQSGMVSLAGKDQKWRDILMDSLFLGMISAFVGFLFANVHKGMPGFVPLVVAFCSALLMAVCGVLIQKCRWNWLEQYALPICMLGAMALSIPISALMAV